jgi:hypothetical protein
MERRPQRGSSCTVAILACIGLGAQALAQTSTPAAQNPVGERVIPILGDIPIVGQLFRTKAPVTAYAQTHYYNPPTPELAKKTVAIMALRGINNLQLSAKDISAALPPLKELRDAEKSLHKLADQALDEEKRALLGIQPGENPPADSGEKMRQEANRYGAVRVKVWDNLAAAVGPEKAGGLFGLMGMTPRSRNEFIAPSGVGAPPRNNNLFRGGAQPPRPDGAPVLFETTPQTTSITPVADGTPAVPLKETIGFTPQEPQALPVATPVPAIRAIKPVVVLQTTPEPVRRSTPVLTPVNPPPGADLFQEPGVKPRTAAPVPSGVRAEAYQRTLPSTSLYGQKPGQDPFRPAIASAGYYPSVRISVSELVELLEQKLGAMRK